MHKCRDSAPALYGVLLISGAGAQKVARDEYLKGWLKPLQCLMIANTAGHQSSSVRTQEALAACRSPHASKVSNLTRDHVNTCTSEIQCAVPFKSSQACYALCMRQLTGLPERRDAADAPLGRH